MPKEHRAWSMEKYMDVRCGMEERHKVQGIRKYSWQRKEVRSQGKLIRELENWGIRKFV
jgi:ribosomal protein L37E